MKALQRTTILFFCILFTASASGQDLGRNLDKYWQYREKLVSQYMLIGDEPGYSLPASYINPTLERMKWSDNTIWLGWYMGTLATEYHLLHNPRYEGYAIADSARRRQENLNELYFALNALIRLDATAETFFPSPCTNLPNQRNGFFIRDDVRASFTDSFPGYNFVDSDYEEHSFANEMSQDQVYHVLLGLALVKHFVPATIVINAFNLHNEAVDEALLIGAWVHQDAWLIKNPVCANKNVDRGHDASLLARGLNAALVYLSDGTVDYGSDVSSFGDLAWTNLATPSTFVTSDNLHMTMTLAAIGEGWGPTTLNSLVALADTNKWFAYPLLYIALRDTNVVSNYTQHKPLINFWADSMLNEAPVGGPLSTYPNQNGHGYGVNNRFIRPRTSHYSGINPGEEGHQWNGLDYMLLHNLQLIVNPNKWPATEIIDTTGIADISGWNANIYPNPTVGNVTLEVPSSFQGYVKFINASGKELLSELLSQHTTQINVEAVPQGVYFVMFEGFNGWRHTQRLVILP